MKIGSLIGLGFGLLWWFVGASAGAERWRTPLLALGIVVFAFAIVWIVRRPTPAGTPDRPRWTPYVVAVLAEMAAIALVQSRIPAENGAELLPPVVGIIVGLHFIGLWLAFARRRFLALSGTMAATNLLALTLPAPVGARIALSGFGSSAALLATAVLP